MRLLLACFSETSAFLGKPATFPKSQIFHLRTLTASGFRRAGSSGACMAGEGDELDDMLDQIRICRLLNCAGEVPPGAPCGRCFLHRAGEESCALCPRGAALPAPANPWWRQPGKYRP